LNYLLEIKRKIMVALGCDLSEKDNVDDLVKSHELNYRWLYKKVHIQGVLFFEDPCSPAERDFRYAPSSLRRESSTVRNSINFLIRSLTPQPRDAGFSLRYIKQTAGMRSLCSSGTKPYM
jgi:hypothetical protein